MEIQDYGPYLDYPKEKIGGDNPYCCCCACKKSDPAINGTLSGHYKDCTWVLQKKKSLTNQKNHENQP